MKKKKSNNYLFIFALLLFIFLMPLIIAIILFNKDPNWLHLKTVNKGTLISTNVGLHQLKLIFNKKKLSNFKHTWLLFYLTNYPCNELCQKNVYQMHQIILALGKYRQQVNYGLIIAKENLFNSRHFVNKDGNLLINIIPKQHVQKIFSELNIKNQSAAYFIADPFGRIILFYPKNTAGEDIYQDLMRLILISTTG